MAKHPKGVYTWRKQIKHNILVHQEVHPVNLHTLCPALRQKIVVSCETKNERNIQSGQQT